MKRFLIIFILSNIVFLTYSQKDKLCKITFNTYIDTNNVNYKMLGSIPNDKDSAFLDFDSDFDKDTVMIILDNKLKFSNVFNSDPSTGYAGDLRIPKTKKMYITIIINGENYGSFKFNKNFSVAHLYFEEKKLKLTYTNQIYSYE